MSTPEQRAADKIEAEVGQAAYGLESRILEIITEELAEERAHHKAVLAVAKELRDSIKYCTAFRSKAQADALKAAEDVLPSPPAS